MSVEASDQARRKVAEKTLARGQISLFGAAFRRLQSDSPSNSFWDEEVAW